MVGVRRRIGAVASQVLNGVTSDFASWSDGAPTHTITTPATDTTYTATYRRRA